MKLIRLNETDSTSVWLMNHASEHDEMTVAMADYQSAGRGMGTNKWESEPGKNLLFSLLLHPFSIPPRWQYLLSMTEAIALRDAVAALVPEVPITIKWPNDIYCGDLKVSGTRIDLNITSRGIRDLVLGTGINVNQSEFHSDAPNPVSLFQLTGKEHSVDDLLNDIMQRFESLYTLLIYKKGQEEIVRKYHERLYRREGFYPYEDKDGEFEAELQEVQPDGILVLRRKDGTISKYEFKQLKFRLTN